MSDLNDKLMADIPRGVTSRYLSQQKVPQARFQDVEKIYASNTLAYDPDNPGKKILFGALDDRLIGIEDNRHILTMAGSRAGKSVTVIGNLLCYKGSVLATDPKAELANLTAKRRAKMGQKVYVLDPFDNASDNIAKYRASYNPMSVLKQGSLTLIEDASLIADAMVVQPANPRDPHWDESAKNFLEGLMLHVATDPRYEGRRTLVTMRDLIKITLQPEEGDDGDDPVYIIEREMLENAVRLCETHETEDVGNAIEGAARGFYDMEAREQANVLSNVRRHTKFLDYRAMRQSLSGHDFDLADLKSDPNGVTIYLCFPATRIEISNRWLRIFVNQLLDAMEREKTPPPAPVLVCLDEFPVLGYMRQLETAAGLIASYDVKLWVLIQDWSQGKALYKDRWETFTGNAGVIQAFGNNDLATTEYLSKRLGRTTVEVTRSSEVAINQREQGMTGQSTAIELHELMTAEEIARIFARNDPQKRQLILWAGYHPMILQRVEYWDENSPVYSYFKDRIS